MVNKAVFQMATSAGKNGHYLRILDDGSSSDGAARNAVALGYTAMTTVDAGSNQFPESARITTGRTGLQITKSQTLDATARPWLIVADDTYFFLYSWSASTVFAQSAPTSSHQTTFSFGQFEPRNPADGWTSVISGRNSSTYSSASSNGTEGTRNACGTAFSANNRTYLAKSFIGNRPGVQASIQNSGVNSAASNSPYSALFTFPDAVTGKLEYTPCLIKEADVNPLGTSGVIRGIFPLIFAIESNIGDVSVAGNPFYRIFDTIQGSGAYAGNTYMFILQGNGSTLYTSLLQIGGTRHASI